MHARQCPYMQCACTMLFSKQTKTKKVVMVQYPGGVHRSMEDIKARYYAVARQLLVGREGTEDSVANNVLVKHPFNLTHERYAASMFHSCPMTHMRDSCLDHHSSKADNVLDPKYTAGLHASDNMPQHSNVVLFAGRVLREPLCICCVYACPTAEGR